jgi:L-rhamnose-H+ transport protein
MSFFGLILAVFSGFLNGSYGLGLKCTGKWQWENIWMLFSVSGLLVLPIVVAFALLPDLGLIYQQVSFGVIAKTFLFGMGWGIGSVCFGVALSLVGLSLGYTIMMGLIAITGSLIPILIHQPQNLLKPGGLVILGSMLVTVLGVICCGRAGAMREKENHPSGNSDKRQSGFGLGLLICLVAGICSSMLNLSFDFGAPLAQAAKAHLGESLSDYRAGNTIWLLALTGGFIPNALYCAYLLFKKRTAQLFKVPGTGIYWFYALIMGAVLIGSIQCYGVAAWKLGEIGTTVGWLIFMTVAVLTGNFWGWITGEWKMAPVPAKRMMVVGSILLIVAIFIVNLGNQMM